MEEKTYFKSTNVTVTQSRFITGSKTYAMRNISSVQMGKISPKIGFPILLIVVGIIIILFNLEPNEYTLIGGVLSVIGILIIVLSKPRYTVQISSTSGETNALVSKDKALISRVVEAVNESIIEMK